MKGSFLQEIILLTISFLQLSQQCSQNEVFTNGYTLPSCQEILAKFPSTLSGYYQLSSGQKVYCDMKILRCGSKGWARIAHVNMSDPNQECPGNFNLYTTPIRSCGGLVTVGCANVTYSTLGLQYSEVCGMAKGYQYGRPDAFGPYVFGDTYSYVDGILIKSAEKKQHIWTFAAGRLRFPSSTFQPDFTYCPCASRDFGGKVPPFVGNDYYCDSGSDSPPETDKFYTDPLWTGEGCTEKNLCCFKRGMPWFHATLPQEITEDIIVENCHNAAGTEDVAVELLELYVR